MKWVILLSMIFILLIAFVWIFYQSKQESNMTITKIMITDKSTPDSAVIAIIDDELRLKKIQGMWRDFEKIDFPPNADWTHGINIEGGDMEGIWLYNQKGYLSRLNYQVKPSFRINNIEEFNRVMGL